MTRWYSGGKEIDIDKMTDQHLLNAVSFLRRQGVVPSEKPDPEEGTIFEAPIDSDAIDDMGALSALARMEEDARKPFVLHCMLVELRRRGLEERVPLSLTREDAERLLTLLKGKKKLSHVKKALRAQLGA